MINYIKSFLNIFSLFPSSKNYDELTLDLNHSMQDFYDRMGWGKYSYPNNNCSFISKNNIDRILEAEQRFNNAIDDYLYSTKQEIITYYDHNPIIKDPARRRINKYL